MLQGMVANLTVYLKLLKIFKAVNTVLGFVSARKQIVITFPTVRSSVEALLKKNEIRVNDDSASALKGRRQRSPDFSISSTTRNPFPDEGEYVLVFELADNSRGVQKSPNNSLITRTAPQPAVIRKLIEERNDRFYQAVDEYV
ncbi:hypothetical protein H0H81_009224 [Sphagnurus paluster]|uniref:Uncharacterized protein n=1 Tax=Sphagnurus paluster TaxID=117069 RepID=A0A9P7KGA6_9AGAR|nr:hypothetical protein H0H81_009224 [Sphagnurus paluster]